MHFPPIRPDRCLLWITLRQDETVRARYAALRTVLRECRLHPLDTTAGAELVIVEEAALEPRLGAIRAALGAGDMIHRIACRDGRLLVSVIAPPEIDADPLTARPPERRPPWLR